MAPTTDPELLVPLLRADIAASGLLIQVLLRHLAEDSPEFRLELEQLLAEMRVNIAKAPIATDDAQRQSLFAWIGVERQLVALSMSLKEPLVPRAVLSEVPPQA